MSSQRPTALGLLTLCALAVGLFASVAAADTKLYWSSWTAEGICRANLEGSNPGQIISGQNNPSGLAIDASAEKIYWADRGSGTVRRANLADGSGVEVVSHVAGGDPNAVVEDVALDTTADKIYFTYNTVVDEYNNTAGRVARMNTDGSGLEVIISQDVFHNVNGLAVDPADGEVYWSTGIVKKANLDGSNSQALFSNDLQANDVAVDPESDVLYWTNEGWQKIEHGGTGGNWRATLVENADIDDIDAPFGIKVDPDAGRVYWTDVDVTRSPYGVYGVDTDGDNPEYLAYAHRSRGVAVGPVPEPATLAMLAAGGLGLAIRRRRR